jgi:hypothetical protein
VSTGTSGVFQNAILRHKKSPLAYQRAFGW